MNRIFVLLVVAAGVLIALALWSDRTEAQPDSADHSVDGGGVPVVAPQPQRADPGARTEVVTEPAPQPPAPPVVTDVTDVAASTLTGRLVYGDGSPVRNASCANWVERAHEYRYLEMATDAEGRFAVGAPVDFDGPGRRFVIRSKSAASVDTPWARAKIGLPDTLPAGETYLGDITVAKLPLLVAGTVRDSAGAGIEGAAVYAMPAGLDIVEMRNPRLPELFRCETDARGRYRIYGAGERTHVVVAKRVNMFQTAIPNFEPGAADVALELAAAGALEGSIAITANFDPRHLHVELSGVPVDGHIGSLDEPVLSTLRPLTTGSSQRLSLDAAGRFRADLLRPGTLRCAIHVRGQTAPVRVFDDVRIEAGVTTADARLQGIGLSDLYTVFLQFIDVAGAPTVREMAVGIRESAQNDWGRRVVSADGALVVSTTSGAFDVLVQQRGYRRQLIEDVRTDRTIFLAAGIEVRATAYLGDSLPPGFEATLRLVGDAVATHPEFEHVEVPRSDAVRVADGQTVTLTVPAPGTYRALVRVQTAGGPADESIDVDGQTPLEIVVPEGGVADPVEIRLEPRAAYRAARVIRTFFPK